MNEAINTFENHAQDSRVKEIEVSDTRSMKDGTGGNNLPLVVFSKASHARNRGGDGERYEESDVAATRNTFDQGETRSQEVVVVPPVAKTLSAEGFDGMPDIHKGNGMQIVATGFSHSNSDMSLATKPTPECAMTIRSVPTGETAAILSVDRYNQATAEEAMHTLKTNLNTGDGSPCVLTRKSVGFLPTNSATAHSIGAQDECSPTLAKGGGESGNKATVAIGCDRRNQLGVDEAQPAITASASDGGPTVAVGVDAYNKTTTGDVSKTLGSAATDSDHTPCAMLKIRSGKDRYVKPDGSIGSGGKGPLVGENQAFTLSTVQDQTLCLSHIVRRLTPIECERLQGFPDDWTKIPWRTYQEAMRKGISYESLLAERGMRLREPTTEDCPDSPRYKALGNSWATNCAEWVLRRIVAAIRLGMIG